MNKFNGPAGLKMGLGTGSSKNGEQSASVQSAAMPMRTANWGALPGKSQPGGRSGGTKKLDQSADEKGI